MQLYQDISDSHHSRVMILLIGITIVSKSHDCFHSCVMMLVIPITINDCSSSCIGITDITIILVIMLQMF